MINIVRHSALTIALAGFLAIPALAAAATIGGGSVSVASASESRCPPAEHQSKPKTKAHSLLKHGWAGKLVLGTWQSVMLVELDGPRERTVHVTLIPG